MAAPPWLSAANFARVDDPPISEASGAPPAPPLLQVQGLSVAYGRGAPALHGVDLEVPAGGIVALVGANGSGKSTLLRALTGLLPAHGGRVTAGAVWVDGRPTTSLAPPAVVGLGVAQVMEGRRLFPGLTVAENLATGAYARKDRAAVRTSRQRVCALFPELAGRLRSPAGELSGGEQQMLAVARALMSSPRLLLLDEPSVGLSGQVVDRLRRALTDAASQGTAVLIAEQNAALALATAGRGYVMDQGRIVLSGAAERLAHDPRLRQAYLGRPVGAPIDPPARPATTRPRTSGPPNGPPVLRLAGVSLRFGALTALDDVTVSVQPREVVAIIGPNGAGKTSVLNCVNRVYRHQGGSISVGPADISGRSPAQVAALGVARTFQSPGVFPGLDVEQNVLLGRHRLGRTGMIGAGLRLPRARAEQAAQRARCHEILQGLGLGPYRHRPVGDLAHGVQKRVDLARALAMEPSLLLLDEPAAGTTADEREVLSRTILRLRTEGDAAVVLVEHDLALVLAVADRVVVLDRGRVVATGTPAEVWGDPRVAQAYLGGAGHPAATPAAAATRGAP